MSIYGDNWERQRRKHAGNQMAELSRMAAADPPSMDPYERRRQQGLREAHATAHRDDWRLMPDRGN